MEQKKEIETNVILEGDALTKLKELPDESIDMCMTSPPYWALRNYEVAGQLGLEPTFDEYIKHLCDIFDEIKRVLKKDGTCWINIADTYYGGGNNRGNTKRISKKQASNKGAVGQVQHNWSKMNYQAKCLCMIPERFAIEMINRGWILRSKIIWHKPNAMPSSAKDRCTVDFEYLYCFSKSKKYYYEQQFEPVQDCTKQRNKYGEDGQGKGIYAVGRKREPGSFMSNQGRNKRCVWTINTKPYKEAHFATYPEKLCEVPIAAGCPKYVCDKCGKAKIKEFKREVDTLNVQRVKRDGDNDRAIGGVYQKFMKENPLKDLGYKPTCNCNSTFSAGIVLDPFFGAGTTGLVALKQGKKFIGIELNPEYIEIIKKRLKPFMEQKIL